MKKSIFTTLIAGLLLLSACEQPRQMYKEIDYGVVFTFPDSISVFDIYTLESFDEASKALPGDRIRSFEDKITIFIKPPSATGKVMKLIYDQNETIKKILNSEQKLSEGTVVKMTDYVQIIVEVHRSLPAIAHRMIKSEILYDDGTLVELKWDYE